jgi:uncharacterized protein YcfL
MKPNLLFSITLILCICGCAPYNKNPVTTYENDSEGTFQRVGGGDMKTKKLSVLNTFKEKVNGVLIAKVEVQNTSAKPTVFKYKFDWVNEDGSVMTGSSVWKTATINGKQSVTYKSADPRGTAVDFRILFKGV